MKKLFLFAILLPLLHISCHLEKLPAIIECANPPIAAFSPSNTNCNAPCVQTLSNNSQNASSYKWDFGDNTASTEANPSHTFTNPGAYVIRLIASNSSGCADTALVTVQVGTGFPTPIANFTVDLTNNNGLAPCAVQFTDASQDETSYAWDFGDGSAISNVKNPVHTYTLPGDYTVKLTVTGQGGTDDETKTVTVKAITFKKTFGTAGNDFPSAVRQTMDGGYIMIGSNDAGMYQVKADRDGKRINDTNWPNQGASSGNDILELPNGLHTILFTSATPNMILCTEQGNPFSGICGSGASYDGYGTATGSSMQKTSDGEIILLGSTVGPNGKTYSYLAKSGNPGWEKIYKTPGQYGYSVQETADGGFIIVGESVNEQANNIDFYLLRTNNQGDSLWTMTYDVTIGDQGTSVQQTSDGGFIVLGTTGIIPSIPPKIQLIRTEANGMQAWKKTIGVAGFSFGASIVVTDDGFVILGTTTGQGAGKSDMYLIKTNTNGDIIWERTFGGLEDDGGASLQKTADGGYILFGRTASQGNGQNDFYLVKTDKNGQVQ